MCSVHRCTHNSLPDSLRVRTENSSGYTRTSEHHLADYLLLAARSSDLYFSLTQLYNFPHSWYHTIVNKRKIAEWQSNTHHKIPREALGTTHWTVFIFVGPIKILFRMIIDTFYFFVHLFVKVEDQVDDIAYLNL